jgi:hypothetical protein
MEFLAPPKDGKLSEGQLNCEYSFRLKMLQGVSKEMLERVLKGLSWRMAKRIRAVHVVGTQYGYLGLGCSFCCSF